MRLLWITDLQSGDHNQEILSFGQFFPKLAIFRQDHRLTPTDLSKNLSFFKTCQNSYTGLFCIPDPQYGDHDQAMLSFGQFRPQNGDFR
jgi:hypothetical protein